MASSDKKATNLILKKDNFQLKKATEAIAMRPTRGRITMLIRKSFNVILHHAMRQGIDVEIYRIRLADLIANVSPGSNDYETFKTYLRKMNGIQVEWHSTTDDYNENWGVSSLLSEAEVIFNKREGYILEYSFAPKIKKRLLDPETYTYIDLMLQSELRTNAGVALHEICTKYATNPSHLTMKEDWRWWSPALTGNPYDQLSEDYLEYKYFKRDVLSPAMKEVNKLTDLEVNLIEHKIGRRVDQIQFNVIKKAQTNLDLGSQLIDSSLLQRMIAIGFKPNVARDVYTEHEEILIRACVEITEARIKNTELPKIISTTAYFKTLLKDKNSAKVVTGAKDEPKIDGAEAVKNKIREAYFKHLKVNAGRMFNEADAEKKNEWETQFVDEFLPTNPQVFRAYKKDGLNRPLVQANFLTWLATITWGMDPTESELLTFAIESKRV